MSVSAQTFTMPVGGKQVTFRVEMLGARRALLLLHKLARHAAPSIGVLATAKSFSDLTVQAAATMIESVMVTLTEADFSDFMDRLMEGVTVNGKELSGMFDDVFAGATKSVFKLWAHVLEVNFTDFFGDLKQASQAFRAAQELTSPNTSATNGQSGA